MDREIGERKEINEKKGLAIIPPKEKRKNNKSVLDGVSMCAVFHREEKGKGVEREIKRALSSLKFCRCIEVWVIAAPMS